MERYRIVLSLAVLTTMVLFSCQHNEKTEHKEEPLNVVLITLDDMVMGPTVLKDVPYLVLLPISINNGTNGKLMIPFSTAAFGQ